MTWYQIVIDILFPLIGFIGGGVGIFFWRENKAMKAAEASKSKTEARLAEADLTEQILKKYQQSVIDRMDSGDAVRKQEFQDLEHKIDKRFDVIEEEDKKQNETLRDVVEYLNGGFQKFEEQKQKKGKKQ